MRSKLCSGSTSLATRAFVLHFFARSLPHLHLPCANTLLASQMCASSWAVLKKHPTPMRPRRPRRPATTFLLELYQSAAEALPEDDKCAGPASWPALGENLSCRTLTPVIHYSRCRFWPNGRPAGLQSCAVLLSWPQKAQAAQAARYRSSVLTIIIDDMDDSKFAGPRFDWPKMPHELDNCHVHWRFGAWLECAIFHGPSAGHGRLRLFFEKFWPRQSSQSFWPAVLTGHFLRI